MIWDRLENIGQYDIYMEAKFKNYRQFQSADSNTMTLNIMDPCGDPTCLTNKEGNCEYQDTVTNHKIADNKYEGDSRKVVFDVNYWAEPTKCRPQIVYSCEVVLGPTTTLCDIPAGEMDNTLATFDTVTGRYELSTTNIIGVQPGIYTLQVTGTLGNKVHKNTFTFEMKNPCLTTRPKLLDNPFLPTHTINLRDSPSPQYWGIEKLAFNPTQVECGPMQVEFAFGNRTPLDTTLFDDQRDVVLDSDAPHSFTMKYTEKVSHAKTYGVFYFVSYVSYPSNYIRSSRMEYILKDPCRTPTELTPGENGSTLVDQVITITEEKKTYDFLPFYIQPDWCDISYTWSVDDDAVKSAARFDRNLKQFSFFYQGNTDLSGPTEEVYTIHLHASAGKGEGVIETSDSFTLTVKNPCINPDYYLITGYKDPDTDSVEYALRSDRSQPIIDFFQFDTVMSSSRLSGICGQTEYVSTYDSQTTPPFDDASSIITLSSKPMWAGWNQQMLYLYTGNSDELGTHTVTMTKRLVEYPSTYDTVQAEINIVDGVYGNGCDTSNLVITAPTLTNKKYTITQNTVQYKIRGFSNNKRCGLHYTFEATGVAEQVVSFNSLTKTLFFYWKDSDLGINSQQVETVTVTASKAGISESASFELTIASPCIDSKYVKLIPPRSPGTISYDMFQGNVDIPFYTFADFRYVTWPIDHNLCGDATYWGFIDP